MTIRERKRTVNLGDKPVGHEGTIEVTRVVYGSPTETVEKVRVPLFTTDVARVSVGGSVTRNMGDYNSIRVEARVELPCYPEPSEIERAYNAASEMVDRFIQQEMNFATGQGTQ